MPQRIASETVRCCFCSPRSLIVPELGAVTPPRMRINVLLPAPFSPISPTTSPGATARLTWERACTPGYDLEMSISSRTGSGMPHRFSAAMETSSPAVGTNFDVSDSDRRPKAGGRVVGLFALALFELSPEGIDVGGVDDL